MANLTELISFIEAAYAFIQALKSSGTLDKLIAAEEAVKTELVTNPAVPKLEALIKGFLAKKAVATTTVTTVTPSV